ncbi:MAG: hypothetical protein ABFD15_04055 [Methanofastidiosum sp.]
MTSDLNYKYTLKGINKSDINFLVKNNISGVLKAFIDNIYLYEDAQNFEKKMAVIFKCVKDLEDQLAMGNTASVKASSNIKNWEIKVTEKQHKFIKKVYLYKEFSLFLNEIKDFSYNNNQNMRAYIICNLFDRYTSKPSLYYAIEDLRLYKKATELEECSNNEQTS